MFGDPSTRPIALNVSTIRPATTPMVLQRRQYKVSRMTGRFAEAATAKASATRCATFWPCARIPMVIASAPTISEQIRAARAFLASASHRLARFAYRYAMPRANRDPANSRPMLIGPQTLMR